MPMYAFRASNSIHVSKLESTFVCREKRGNVLPPSWQKANLVREIENFSFRVLIVAVSPFSADKSKHFGKRRFKSHNVPVSWK